MVVLSHICGGPAAGQKASESHEKLQAADIKNRAERYVNQWLADFQADPAGRHPVLSALTTPAYKALDGDVQNQVLLTLTETALRTMPLDRATRVARELRQYETTEAAKGCQAGQACFIRDVLSIEAYDPWTKMAATYEGVRVFHKKEVNIDTPSAHLVLGQLTGERPFALPSAATVSRARQFVEHWRSTRTIPNLPDDLEFDASFRQLSLEVKTEVFGQFLDAALKPVREQSRARLKQFEAQEVERAEVAVADLLRLLGEKQLAFSKALDSPETLALKEPERTAAQLVLVELAGREARSAFRRHLELGRGLHQPSAAVSERAVVFLRRWRMSHSNSFPEAIEADSEFRRLEQEVQIEVFGLAVDGLWEPIKAKILSVLRPMTPRDAQKGKAAAASLRRTLGRKGIEGIDLLHSPEFVALPEGSRASALLDLGESIRLMARDAHRANVEFGANHRDRARTLANLAELYDLGQEYSRAEPLYRDALSILDPQTPESFFPWNTREMRKLAAAMGHPIERGDPEATRVSYALGINLLRQGRSVDAITALRRAMDLEQDVFDRILAGSSVSQKQAAFDQLTSHLDVILNLQSTTLPPSPAAQDLALTALLQRKGRLLDTLTDEFAAIHETLEQEWEKAFTELRDVREVMAALAVDGATSRLRLDELRRRESELEVVISRRASERTRRTEPIKVSEVSRLVPPGSALVEFVRYTSFDLLGGYRKPTTRYSAYVIRSDREPAWVDLGSATEIDITAAQFNAALGSPANDAVAMAMGRQLAERLVKPIEGLVKPATHLLLAPDGNLNLVPFAALVGDDGKFLLSSFDLTYLSAGRDLLRFEDRVPSRQSARFFANPTFASTPLDSSVDSRPARRRAMPQLPETETEAMTVAALLRDAEVLLQQHASKANVAKLSGPAVLHMATHGVFAPTGRGASDDNAMLRSGIVLSDGVLTAAEAATLDLSGTDLVVLSACETGRGEVRAADGVAGLRRAFVLAGARSQLLTLWRIDSETTRDLMIDFYRRLLAGAEKSSALLSAQRSLAAAGVSPHYWAPFILSGDGGALSQ